MVWRDVALSEIAHPFERRVQVLPGTEYRTIGVRWWGEGAYERPTIDGTQTAARTLNLVRRDDLIINKIWVRHGSVAVADGSVDGCAASGEFPTFQLDRSAVLPEWMHWQCKAPAFWTKCAALSHGSSGKNRIRPDVFLTVRIQIPPLDEQRRIVARIEELAGKIEEARCLHQQITVDRGAALATMARRPELTETCKLHAGWTKIQLGDVLNERRDPHAVTPEGSYPNVGIYSFGRGVFQKPPIAGSSTSARTVYRVHAQQFIYSRLFAFEGAYGIVPNEVDGFFVSNEYPTFDLDKSRILSAFLEAYFLSPAVWTEISSGSKGLGHRRQRVHPDKLMSHRLLLPPLSWQKQIASISASFRRMAPEDQARKKLLDALLPSLLERAFTGNL